MPADIVGYLYAATVAAGGIMGYVKAGLFKVQPLGKHFFIDFVLIF